MRSDFELAELLWDVAEPRLSDLDRSEMCVALHTSEPLLSIVTSVRALTRHRIPLPRNLFDEFHQWLQASPALCPDDPWLTARLELHALASDVLRGAHTADIGGYSPETLCYFILEDAGVTEGSREEQALALRRWLMSHRASPALRADLVANGFGYLVADGPGSMW